MKKILSICLVLVALSIQASIKEYKFESAEQEKRFKHLVFVLRCPTCQNQNLADSNSMVADDLKQIVYEKVIAGESDEQILAFMKQRYGAFILYEPEMTQENWLLWGGPFIFMIVVFAGFFVWYYRRKGDVHHD